MKKSLLIGLTVLMAAGLSSCGSKESENTMTTRYVVPAYNLITNGESVSLVSPASYQFSVAYPDYTATLSVSNMIMPGSFSGSFGLMPIPLTMKSAEIDGEACQILEFSASDPSQSGQRVTDLKCVLSQAAYRFPSNIAVPGYEKASVPGTMNAYLAAQYMLNGQLNVKTFWNDVTFSGESTVVAGAGPMSTGETFYRVVMNNLTGNTTGNYSADVLIYNYRGGKDEEPATYVLKGLSLAFDTRGYEVAGHNVVAKKLVKKSGAQGGDVNELQDDPEFTVRDFKLTSAGDLVSAAVSYSAGNARVTFNGRYLKSADNK